jgi:hypothetical protein
MERAGCQPYDEGYSLWAQPAGPVGRVPSGDGTPVRW